MEREMQKDLKNMNDFKNELVVWMRSVLAEKKKIDNFLMKATSRFLTQPRQKMFPLTSKMIIRLTLNTEKRASFQDTQLSQLDNPPIYTPYEYTIYDLKVPNTDEVNTIIIAHTKLLKPGLYDIMDEVYFKDMYVHLFKLHIPRGFYTPKSLSSKIQKKMNLYMNKNTFN